MTRSYREICVALRYGVIVQRKATMRYASDVSYLTAGPSHGVFGADGFTVVPIEAPDALGAARRVAEITARDRYGDQGTVTNVARVGYVFRPGAAQDVYHASIGNLEMRSGNCVNVGCSISIRLYPVD